MCKICGVQPCISRCPNAADEILVCCECGDEINGSYCSIQGIDLICEHCLMDMSGYDLAERLGYIEYL